MNKVKTAFRAFALVATAIFLLSSQAHAQDENSGYFGLHYAALDTDLDFLGDYSTPVLMFNIGAQITPVFAIEGRLGLAAGDDSKNVTIGDVSGELTIEVENYVGIFARVGIPDLGGFYPYVIAGFGEGDIGVSGRGGSDTAESDTETAFGIGADINFGETVGGKLEYMNYYDKDDVEISGISFGLNFNF